MNELGLELAIVLAHLRRWWVARTLRATYRNIAMCERELAQADADAEFYTQLLSEARLRISRLRHERRTSTRNAPQRGSR